MLLYLHQIDRDVIQPHFQTLLEVLLSCFQDESWPVRDAACVACGNFIKALPDEARYVSPWSSCRRAALAARTATLTAAGPPMPFSARYTILTTIHNVLVVSMSIGLACRNCTSCFFFMWLTTSGRSVRTLQLRSAASSRGLALRRWTLCCHG